MKARFLVFRRKNTCIEKDIKHAVNQIEQVISQQLVIFVLCSDGQCSSCSPPLWTKSVAFVLAQCLACPQQS